jgi:hypothetical protein
MRGITLSEIFFYLASLIGIVEILSMRIKTGSISPRTNNRLVSKIPKSTVTESQFMGVFSDVLEEVETPMKLRVQGKLPRALSSGTLIRNGPAVFGSLDSNKRRYTHAFDGLAKLMR